MIRTFVIRNFVIRNYVIRNFGIRNFVGNFVPVPQKGGSCLPYLRCFCDLGAACDLLAAA